MKLLILSDSHGNLKTMRAAIEKEKPQAIIHLGDYWRDAGAIQDEVLDIPMYRVAGNCDQAQWHQDQNELLVCRLGGAVFYMAHGHRHGVKMSLTRLWLAAREAGAKVALFGHTHSALLEERDGVLLMNPGTCSGFSGTYGVIEVDDGRVVPEIRSLSKIGQEDAT